MSKFFLTTPIYYVNARPHIGHAYTTIVADVIARRHRLLGPPVGEDGLPATYFLTGTDEHGQKIERSAQAAGIAPQQFADEVSASFQTLWRRMGITNDDFIRTTEPRHKQGAQKLFADLFAAGQIYLSSYTGQYSVGEEMFVEGPPGTLGPDGRPTETVTEENFFFRLSDFQRPLLDLIEADTLKSTPDSRKNEVLSFLRGNVNPIRAPFMAESHPAMSGSTTETQTPGTPRPASETWEEVLPTPAIAYSTLGNPYVPGALRDLSVSRSSFTWGIPVPEPAASLTQEKHVIYVWLDALANYMTALGYGSAIPDEQARFEKYWPADLHLVGKEIIRFHCVYWPAFLLALNPKLARSTFATPAAETSAEEHGLPPSAPTLSLEEHKEWAAKWLPKSVTAHGWLLFDDSKMSKSKGNIVRTETILDAFGEHVYKTQFPESTKQEQDLFAADVLRYFLLREIPFGQDGSFSFEALWQRYDSDLTNSFGNLVSRTLTMLNLYRNGLVPNVSQELRTHLSVKEAETFLVLPSKSGFSVGQAPAVDNDYVRGFLRITIDTIAHAFETPYNFYLACETLKAAVSVVDTYINNRTPWKLAKESGGQVGPALDNILYVATESCRVITALHYPILPYATAKVWHQLGLGDIELAAKEGKLTNLQWGGLQPGTKLGPLSPIFPRAPKELAQTMADMEAAQQNALPNSAQRKLEDSPLTHTTAQADAATSRHTEFAEAPISAPLAEDPTDPTHPGAAPRTASLTEPNPGTHVGASAALTTERSDPTTRAPLMAEPHPAMSGSASVTTPDPSPPDVSPQITIDDFAKVELRVAQVVLAERIPKADKLLRLEVDLGYERRQILSGIAEWYTPEDLLGRRIVVITNLAPRKMRGLDSHGMLLAASAPDGGKPALATFADTDTLPLGSRLK